MNLMIIFKAIEFFTKFYHDLVLLNDSIKFKRKRKSHQIIFIFSLVFNYLIKYFRRAHSELFRINTQLNLIINKYNMNIIDSNTTMSRNLLMGTILTIISPLDLVKSRLQTMPQLLNHGHLSQSYKGAIDCFKTIKRNQGIRSLWKGNTLGIARFFPYQYLNLKIKRFFSSFGQKSFFSNTFCGMVGGWGSSAVFYPIDTIRILISNSPKSTEAYYLKNIVKKCGIISLYRGYFSSFLGVGLYRGSFYGIYDTLKVTSQNFKQKFACAYFSSLAANLLVYPLDTIRKRRIMGNSCQNSLSFFLKVVNREGIRGIFRGSSISLLQSLASALILILFDNQKTNTI